MIPGNLHVICCRIFDLQPVARERFFPLLCTVYRQTNKWWQWIRWGGEEFVVLRPNTALENGMRAAERVRKAVANHTFTGLSGNKITVSIGVAAIPATDLNSQDKLIHAADLAMYTAKKNGRNRVESA